MTLPTSSENQTVLTMTDYYDAPRRGIANLFGVPHIYHCHWNNNTQYYEDFYYLKPIYDKRALEIFMEDWAIWTDWRTGFDQGTNSEDDTFPCKAKDKQRHEELAELMKRPEFSSEIKNEEIPKVLKAVGRFSSRRLGEELLIAPKQVNWSQIEYGPEYMVGIHLSGETLLSKASDHLSDVQIRESNE